MILFEPGPPTPPLHRRHPAVRLLDRAIRSEQTRYWASGFPWHGRIPGTSREERRLQLVRRALVGKPLRPHVRSGKYARQKRLAL